MNILFVNYGDYTTNSLNHIGGFANTLCAAGHACVVAVPHRKETLQHVANPLFIAATFDEALARPTLFPDGRSADLIHAWTPRECVRKFVVSYQRASLDSRDPSNPARVIIHLEDNERFLLEGFTGKSFSALRETSAADLEALLNDSLPHPVRHESFLRIADGVTHIIDKLAEFAPPDTPTHLLFPGVDFSLYQPQPPDPSFRDELGLPEEEHVIAFTGSNTFANEPEMRELYLAVALLNQRGTPTTLIRTGFNSPRFLDGLSKDVKQYVKDLGFIEKAKLPRLLALADILVQPGRPGPFNDYRLPSKLPEFLASGKPVVLPPTNLAALMKDGREAVFLPTGSPEEIADVCQRLLGDVARCFRLGEAAVGFARTHFDLATNTRGLIEFYTATVARPPATNWSMAKDPTVSDATLFASSLADRFNQAAASLNDPAAQLLATQTDLLAHVVRQLEQSIESSARHRIAAVETERDAILAREKLTLQHVRNIEDLLAAAKEHAAGLEKSREMTQVYADNMGRELEKHKQRREQADVLLHTARQQVAAYENALLGADAEIESLKGELANLKDEYRKFKDDITAELAAARAEHAAAAALATDRLAQAEAIVRSRDEKIAKMQSSFSWKATTPFRAVRRAFFDRPAPPPVSPKLLGNIDYPQDWSNIPRTLNVRGWSLHRDRVPLKAVRARLDDKAVRAEFGSERLDVLDHFRDYPGASHCGWQVKADVPRHGR
ncbi:MAG: glycosyltransferase, partial [Opitutaceae bacterium]